MSRIHFFEFEDQPWFPRILRELMTDQMSFMAESIPGPYKPFAERLHQVLMECKEQKLVDLCTGGGGPAWAITRLLRERLGHRIELLLTDLYPNQTRLTRVKERDRSGSTDFCPDSIDATQVPPSIKGFRLLCNSFHHFRKEQARAILADAIKQRQGIAIVEVLERSWGGLALLPFLTGMVFVAAPFIRPFRLSRFLFTYVIPAVPLFILWDGMVSCLRVYSPDELQELVASLSEAGEDPGYEWEIDQIRETLSPAPTTFLIGRPR